MNYQEEPMENYLLEGLRQILGAIARFKGDPLQSATSFIKENQELANKAIQRALAEDIKCIHCGDNPFYKVPMRE